MHHGPSGSTAMGEVTVIYPFAFVTILAIPLARGQFWVLWIGVSIVAVSAAFLFVNWELGKKNNSFSFFCWFAWPSSLPCSLLSTENWGEKILNTAHTAVYVYNYYRRVWFALIMFCDTKRYVEVQNEKNYFLVEWEFNSGMIFCSDECW